MEELVPSTDTTLAALGKSKCSDAQTAFSCNGATILNATLGRAVLLLFLRIRKPDLFKESSKYWPITLLDLNKLKSFILRNKTALRKPV